MAPAHPLLQKVIPAAEELVRQEHFSIENLCTAVDCSLRELAEAVGTVDDVIAHVNDRFMGVYIARAMALDAQELNDLKAVQGLCGAWFDHALAHPQNMELLLNHRWSNGFERPEWYMERVAACFRPMEARLRRLAPDAGLQAIAGAARGFYAQVCGLYFLSANERAKPAGISSVRGLLALNITLTVHGLATPVG